MGKRTTLLATVALPIASLVWQPVEAAVVRPALDVGGHVITVQDEGSARGGEELPRERRERRKAREEVQGGGGEQEGRQKAREERRQKQREAEAEQQQQEKRQNAREERRQKQREAEAEQQQQEKRQNAREERRQKQREAEAEQQQEKRQNAREERRQKQREAEAEQQQEERRKARRERQREAERGERSEDDTAERPRRKRDADRERIARDPASTIETIILPLLDGAAVLDSDKDWDNRRDSAREDLRRKRDERRNVRVRVPESDRDAQVGWEGRDRVRYESGDRERGERRDRRPRYQDRDGWRVEREVDDRVVINFDDRIIVRSDDGGRLSRHAAESYFEDLPNGRVREVIVRSNGDRVLTIRNRYGDVIQRSRIDRSGHEYVMFYAPEIDRDSRPTFEDPGDRLPPMRLTIPVDDYIIDTSSEGTRDYGSFLGRPPVEPVERVYTLDEVKYSARIRDKVRRIDLDTITFATGSSDISMNQASTLRSVAEAMNKILDKDPGETFLIEGHTDAVGSDQSNLVLSDERAEAVANVLTDVYEIPPENLATQGYGERFLKIDTDGAEQLNRRVTIRRVTPLVKPVAMVE